MEIEMAKNLERAKYIKNARKQRGWPQGQLADVAGLNLRTIQRIEKDGVASLESQKAIAAALDIDVQILNSISKKNKEDLKQEIHLLPRINSGKELAAIINGADNIQVEHDEAEDKRMLNAMIDIAKLIKQDVIRWYDSDFTGKMRIEFELTQEINGLESFGVYLFGIKRMVPDLKSNIKAQKILSTIYMSHSKSKKIVKDKKSNMVIPAKLTEVIQ